MWAALPRRMACASLAGNADANDADQLTSVRQCILSIILIDVMALDWTPTT
jgi:hypothetical protein